jgi:hypothetical protein
MERLINRASDARPGEYRWMVEDDQLFAQPMKRNKGIARV